MANILNTVKQSLGKLFDSYKILSEVPIFVIVFVCVFGAYFVFSYVYNTFVKYVLDSDAGTIRIPGIIAKSFVYLINSFLTIITLITLLGNNYGISLLILILAVIVHVLLPKIRYEKEAKMTTGDNQELADLYTYIYKQSYFWFFIVASTLTYILKILFVFVF